MTVTDPGAGFTSYGVGEGTAPCTAPGSNPTAPPSFTLAEGPDRLADIAVSGTLADGRCRYGHALVQLDRAAPTAVVGVRALTGTDARTVFSWDGTDPAPASGIASWTVEILEASGRRVRTSTPTTADSVVLTLRAGWTYFVRASAVDYAGNRGPVVTSARYSVPLDDATFGQRGDWSRRASPRTWYGGHARATKPGSYASRRVTAKAYDLVFTGHPTGGYVEVYVDGRLIRRVDTYSAKTAYRKVVRVATYPTMATRVVTFRVAHARHRSSKGYTFYFDGVRAVY